MTSFASSGKIAIVYDWLDTRHGGAERVIKELLKMYPDAHFFAGWGEKDIVKEIFGKNRSVKYTFLQKFPNFFKKHKSLMMPFMPLAFWRLDLANYDVVISVTSLFAKCLNTKSTTRHICYLLTPPRYIWEQTDITVGRTSIFFELILFPFKFIFKIIDKKISQFPNQIISISKLVSNRVRKYYQRDSLVIYPPFDNHYWKNINDEKPKSNIFENFYDLYPNYYLYIGRLTPYKKVDLILKACKILQFPLIVVGNGSSKGKLMAISGERCIFLSDLKDSEIAFLYDNAKALIMPQREDFGYTSLEAQSRGCPIITYQNSGTIETIIFQKTGISFESQTAMSLLQILEKYDIIYKDLKKSIQNELKLGWLEKFSNQNFKYEFTKILNQNK